jgi:hypothetical protein
MTDLQTRTSDLTSMKKELAALSKENARLTSENKTLASSLTTSQNESKTLSNKLAAARSSSQQPDPKHVPGSAVKPRSNGIVLPGTAEAAKEALLAKQKVDLYSDLTNLVILSMKRNEDEEDVYDCLQTGRNGSTYSPESSQTNESRILTAPPQLSTSTSRSQRHRTQPTKMRNSYISRYSMNRGIRICWIYCRII